MTVIGNPRRTSADACPACLHPLDGVSSLGEAETPEPAVGDVTVCIYCASVLEWAGCGDQKVLTKAPAATIAQLAPEQRHALARARYAAKHLRGGGDA
jgi:uncharacterized protein (DUF2237 family)